MEMRPWESDHGNEITELEDSYAQHQPVSTVGTDGFQCHQGISANHRATVAQFLHERVD